MHLPQIAGAFSACYLPRVWFAFAFHCARQSARATVYLLRHSSTFVACYTQFGAPSCGLRQKGVVVLLVVVAQFPGMAVVMDERERMRSFVPTQRGIILLLRAPGLLLD